jgi:transcriptional regulator with XRE-family HTH domain
MIQSQTEPEMAAPALLSGWISRKDLADALGVTVDTLGRWEARRVGPPCVRAGRMVLYRRAAVQDWLAAQEMPRAKAAGGRR